MARLKELVGAVEGSRSVLVEGPGGSGKSVLVQTQEKPECVTVFMGEQIDSKVGIWRQVLFAACCDMSSALCRHWWEHFCVQMHQENLCGHQGYLPKVCINLCSGYGVKTCLCL